MRESDLEDGPIVDACVEFFDPDGVGHHCPVGHIVDGDIGVPILRKRERSQKNPLSDVSGSGLIDSDCGDSVFVADRILSIGGGCRSARNPYGDFAIARGCGSPLPARIGSSVAFSH